MRGDLRFLGHLRRHALFGHRRPTYPFVGSLIHPKREQILVLSDMESLSGWTGPIVGDGTHVISGSQAGKITSTNAAFVDCELQGPWDLVGRFIDFWVYIDDINNLDGLFLYLFQGSSNHIYYLKEATINRVTTGWNHVRVLPGSYSLTGGPVVDELALWSSVTKLRIRVRSKAGTTVNVWVDQITAVESPLERGIIAFGFDDASRTMRTAAAPIFNKYNVPATFFVVTSLVDTSNFVTKQQLYELRDMGWTIASHTVTHRNLTTLSPTELRRELRDSQKWIADNGFSPRSIAYPQGVYNRAVIEETAKYYECGRGIGVPGFTNLPVSPWTIQAGNYAALFHAYNVPSFQLNSSSFASTYPERLKLAAKFRMAMTTYTHEVPGEITASELESAILMALDLGMDIISFDELLDINAAVLYRRDAWQDNLMGEQTVDLGPISPGSVATFTIQVVGAEPGNAVYVGAPPTVEDGLIWSAVVSAQDTVTVRVYNPTGSSIDPAPGTWTAVVVRQ